MGRLKAIAKSPGGQLDSVSARGEPVRIILRNMSIGSHSNDTPLRPASTRRGRSQGTRCQTARHRVIRLAG
eukprot:2690246-Prymnesium_polylepis.1